MPKTKTATLLIKKSCFWKPKSSFVGGKNPAVKGCEQLSKKITTHPDIAHPRQSPWPTMKGIPAYSLLVKVARGVFQRCVGNLGKCWKRPPPTTTVLPGQLRSGRQGLTSLSSFGQRARKDLSHLREGQQVRWVGGRSIISIYLRCTNSSKCKLGKSNIIITILLSEPKKTALC